MTALTRIILATLFGLVLAAGVHVMVILASPHFAEQDAFAKIHQMPAADRAQIVSAPGGGNTWLPLPDPSVAVAACGFDLSKGPVRVAAQTGSLPLSLSFHTKTDGVFFAVTDRAAVRGELEIVTMTPRQLDEARAAEDENEPSRDVRIVAPEQQGFIVVRVAAPTRSLRPQAEESAKAVSCVTDQSADG